MASGAPWVSLCWAALVLLVLLVAFAAGCQGWLPAGAAGRDAFMTYPYLDLWDQYDAGDKGTYYGLMECRPWPPSLDRRPG